jgi:hypothetical protein
MPPSERRRLLIVIDSPNVSESFRTIDYRLSGEKADIRDMAQSCAVVLKSIGNLSKRRSRI